MSRDRPTFTHSTDPRLLFRLRDWQDQASWTEFYRLYYEFVYGFARRSGLSHADAEEVTQDVFQGAAEAIHGFESDPRRGTFRGWMITMTRWRISDKFRQRPFHERRPDCCMPLEHPRLAEGVAQEGGADAGAEAEWQALLLETALRRLGRRVPPKQYQIFDLYSRREWPALRVAGQLGVNPATVYLVHHRLTKMLKDEIKRLEAQLR